MIFFGHKRNPTAPSQHDSRKHMWVIVSCHPWTGVVGRMQDAFFPSSPMIPEGLRVSTCIAPPLSWDAWHCLIYKNRVSHAPNPSKSNIKSHAVHLDIPILACTAWMLNNKKQLISWSFLFLSCVFPTLKMFIRFPKKLFGTVFFAQMLLIICFEVFSALRKRAE